MFGITVGASFLVSRIVRATTPSALGAQVEPISAQQPVHPHHQIGLGRFDHQMKMVARQAIRMRPPAGLLTGLRQRLQQPLPILVILEDGRAPVAPIHPM